MIIQGSIIKSRPLLSVHTNDQSEITLISLKLFDFYLSRINPLNQETKTVLFKKSEITKLLSQRRMRTDTFVKGIRMLLRMSVTNLDKSEPENKGKEVNLFTANPWVLTPNKCEVSLTATNESMGLFFDLFKVQHYHFNLSDTINLTSINSYFLFNYLLIYAFQKEWTVDLITFRNKMNIKENEYTQNKHFIDKVLKPSIAEINKKTGYKVIIQTIKKNNSIESIHFEVIEEPKCENSQQHKESQIQKTTTTVLGDYDIPEFKDERLNQGYNPYSPEALVCSVYDDIFKQEYDFDKLLLLAKIVCMIPDDTLMEYIDTTDFYFDDILIVRYLAVEKALKKCLEQGQKKKIYDKLEYTKKILKNLL